MEFPDRIIEAVLCVRRALVGNAKPTEEKLSIESGLVERKAEGKAAISGDFIRIDQPDRDGRWTALGVFYAGL